MYLKSDCRRDARSTVGSPSPILMKLAPEVRQGPKRNLATPFRPKRPVQPAQGPPKWSFLSFFKICFLVIFLFSQSVEICLLGVFGRFLAPKCPVFQIVELGSPISESSQIDITLRVFAGEILGAYCRGCRQPESDFDETRTRGASGPQTKFGAPFSATAARSAGPGASKVEIFCFFEKWFFGQIFFLSKQTDMFAMGFW